MSYTGNFEGATTALITPMHSNGEIDWASFEKNLRFQCAYIDNILFCGTTAQSPTLTCEEHKEINEKGIRIARIYEKPMISGCGSNSTKEAIESTRHAYSIGADGVLHVTGYYNWPSQEGIYNHFRCIADIFDIRIIAYDVPGRGHPSINPITRIAMAEDLGIDIVKDATGNRDIWLNTRGLANEHEIIYTMLSGDDPNTYEMMSNPEIDADGVVSVTSNIFPKEVKNLCYALKNKDYDNAKKIDEKIRPFNEIISMKLNTRMKIGKKEYVIENDSYKNPISTHVAMHMLGMIDEPYVRPPLSQLPDEGYKKVGKTLLQMYRKNPEIFEPIKRHFKVDIEKKLKCYE